MNMKQTLIYLLAAVIAVAGCTKETPAASSDPETPAVPEETPEENEESEENASDVYTFTASTQTRSSLDGKAVVWQEKDYLSIYDASGNNNGFTFDSEDVFTGTLADAEGPFYAVYPNLKSEDIDATYFTADADAGTVAVTTFLPSFQLAEKDSFTQGANVSACSPVLDEATNRLSGTMMNLCGYIKFTVGEGSGISRIRFSSNRKLSGKCTVEFDAEGNPSISGQENKFVYCGTNGGGAMDAGTYVVTAFPTSGTATLTVTVTTTDGEVYERTSENAKIIRNEYLDLGDIVTNVMTAEYLTDYTSILVNFTKNAHNTDLAESPESSINVTFNGKSYAMDYSSMTYSSYGYAQFAKGAYVITPAIEGKTLKDVVVSWRSHAKNGFANMVIKTADSDAKNVTGVYKAAKSGVNEKLTYALPTMNNVVLRASHIFSPYVKNDGESAVTFTETAQANTSYKLITTQGTSCVEYIELIYK